MTLAEASRECDSYRCCLCLGGVWNEQQSSSHYSVTDRSVSLPVITYRFNEVSLYYGTVSSLFAYVGAKHTIPHTLVASKPHHTGCSCQSFEVTGWQVIKDRVTCLDGQKCFLFGSPNIHTVVWRRQNTLHTKFNFTTNEFILLTRAATMYQLYSLKMTP